LSVDWLDSMACNERRTNSLEVTSPLANWYSWSVRVGKRRSAELLIGIDLIGAYDGCRRNRVTN
jgi:hypothetical protein